MSRYHHASRRYRALLEKHKQGQVYRLPTAIASAKAHATAQFDENIEVAINLNLKKSETVRGTVRLPHLFGKEQKIIVFAKGEKVREAETAGAAFVGSADLIEKIKGGWLDFDIAVATPDVMKDVASLGPILGRRGLMPNPKTGTVTMDLAYAIQELKGGRKEFRADKAGTIHCVVGKASMDAQHLSENVAALFDSVQSNRPDTTKGVFIQSSYLTSTMGVGIAFNVEDASAEEQ